MADPDRAIGTASADIVVNPVNDAPTIEVGDAPTAQYSDRIVPISITAEDIDDETLDFSLVDVDLGLDLSITDIECAATVDGRTSCSASVEGVVTGPAGSLELAVRATDRGGAEADVTSVINLSAEQARIGFGSGNPAAVEVEETEE